MKLEIKKGTTSKLIEIFISNSLSTTGAGLIGVLFGDISGYYYRSGAAIPVTEFAALKTMTVGTWVTEGFKEIDATNMPGYYQLGIPDAALLAGADQVNIMLKGAANMAPLPLEIQLVDNIEKDVFDIANHASYGNAKLVRSTTPGNALDVNGNGNAGIDWGNIDNKTSANDLSQTDIQLCDTTTTNSDMRGTDGANTTTPPTVGAIADQVWDETISGHTGGTSFGGKNQKVVPSETINDYKADVSSVTVGTNNDKTGYALSGAGIDSIWDETFTEPSAGAPPAITGFRTMLSWLWMHFRNKGTLNKTTGEAKIYNDVGTEIAKGTDSDDGTTFTKGKLGAPS